MRCRLLTRDLLDDRFIPVRVDGSDGADQLLTLPELYEHLASDSVHSFSGLAAHQAPSWYLFLSQLGALAAHGGGLTSPPVRAEEWRSLLVDLAPAHAATAWKLVGHDPREPAFLQPPTDRIADFKTYADTPDGLDLLVKAKNHDRKRSQVTVGSPHLWLYSLVALQTAQGFSGRGRQGIARMNGGFSSRPLVDLRPGPRWGARVVRAIRMLLARRRSVLDRVGESVYRESGGLALTWLRSWDDDRMLSLADLDPYFIEVCRRLRLVEDGGRIVALARPAMKNPRIDAKAFRGNLGDPWVPLDVRKDPPAALTVSAGGFDYRLVRRILLKRSEFKPPVSLTWLAGERHRDMELHLATLVRGQGKTEGFHERVVPLPGSVMMELGFDGNDADSDDDESSLAQLSDKMVDLAGNTQKVLRRAILVFLQGPENPNFQKKDAAPVLARFDRRVDEHFFDHLFAAPDSNRETAETDWQCFLRKAAERLAGEAWESLSAPSARREKARAAAEAILAGGLRKQLPDAFRDAATKEH